MRTGFLTLVYGLILSFSALAAPFDNITTHNATVPEPSFQLAATWFLPDWQATSSSRTETAPSGSGDRHDLTCSTYGGCAGIPANMTCSQSFRVDGTNCYKSCSCKSGYNRVSSSDVCAGCVNPCDSVTDQGPCTYGCQTAYSTCSSKCQTCYSDNCRNYPSAPGLNDTTYGCQTAYDDCSSKCKTPYTDGCHNYPNAIAVEDTTYGCKEAYDDCSSKCKTPYEDNCHTYKNSTTNPLVDNCSEGCAKDETADNCDSKCKNGCRAKCNTGYKLNINETGCVEESCPTEYDTEVTDCGKGYDLKPNGQSGDLPCNKCVAKTACTEGSTSCNKDTENATANGYYVGDSPCYICTAKTCKQMGKKDCNGSCIATSECCDGCPTNYACQDGSCVELCTPPSSSQGWVPMSQTPSSPNVTIYPTGATGTGTNSCFLAEWMTTEETTDDGCNNQYHRYCLDLSPANGWFYENVSIRCTDGAIEWDKKYQQDGCGRQFECCVINMWGNPPAQRIDYCEACTYLTSALSVSLPQSANQNTVFLKAGQLCTQSSNQSECNIFNELFAKPLYQVMFIQKTHHSKVCRMIGTCIY